MTLKLGIAVLALGLFVGSARAQTGAKGSGSPAGQAPAATTAPTTGKTSDFKQDSKDIKKDKQDIQRDRRDIRHDRKDLRREVNHAASANHAGAGAATGSAAAGNGASIGSGDPSVLSHRQTLKANRHHARSMRRPMRTTTR